MTSSDLIERITRSLAYMLRHQPEKFDLELDAHGWGDLDEVVRALIERLDERVERSDVENAIESGDRPRYEIEGDRIRALYGHSIDVEPGEPARPPELLYVGISARDAERAVRNGMRGGRRRFLHLALTEEDARESGRRSGREYAVITVYALDAWEEGVSFYDRKSLFLSEQVPTEFLEVTGTYSDGIDRPPMTGRGPGSGGAGGRHGDRGGREGGREGGRRDRPRRGRGGGDGHGRGRDVREREAEVTLAPVASRSGGEARGRDHGRDQGRDMGDSARRGNGRRDERPRESDGRRGSREPVGHAPASRWSGQDPGRSPEGGRSGRGGERGRGGHRDGHQPDHPDSRRTLPAPPLEGARTTTADRPQPVRETAPVRETTSVREDSGAGFGTGVFDAPKPKERARSKPSATSDPRPAEEEHRGPRGGPPPAPEAPRAVEEPQRAEEAPGAGFGAGL